MLDHENDPVLKTFGITVSKTMKTVDGRLLVAPKVQFGQGTATPGTSGRWDLKAKKFLTPNAAPLKSWSVCVVPGRRGGKPDKVFYLFSLLVKRFADLSVLGCGRELHPRVRSYLSKPRWQNRDQAASHGSRLRR